MPLKKQRSGTTNVRYRLKMYGVGIGKAVGNEQLAMEFAIALSEARAAGFQPLAQAHTVVEDVCSKAGVPRGIWGIYYAFANFYVSKVLTYELYNTDEAVNHFVKLGADAGILGELANRLSGVTYPATTSGAKPKKG